MPEDTRPDRDEGAEDAREDSLRALSGLHDEVDRAVASLAEPHGARLRCGRGCSDCCVDGLTVFDVEAERIRRFARNVLREPPWPPGACAFLDADGACRIYPHRPYVCRTQGLPLRWIEKQESGEIVEHRDICTLNEAGAPVETLRPDECWTIGPTEGRLADLQKSWGGNLERVALRDLFVEPDASTRRS